jgi:hypothetical protein
VTRSRDRGAGRVLPTGPRPGDAGGPAIAAIGTALGVATGALLVVRLAYAYADASLIGRELQAAALIVYGGFGGGIAGGAAACWAALRVGRRAAPGETAWRTLAFLFMLAPLLLFSTPVLDITPLASLGLGVVAAALAGAVARLLTPGRAPDASSRRMP